MTQALSYFFSGFARYYSFSRKGAEPQGFQVVDYCPVVEIIRWDLEVKLVVAPVTLALIEAASFLNLQGFGNLAGLKRYSEEQVPGS
ncbi:hypothetical protein G4D82_03645 [Flavobacterium sp. CYK-4]|uniref:hypothetical protein n=1 Tax=Flavobacterium lotistagni TaxID=2709660 RepID=UPI0014073715|nr:hypothetical protein [Flavobacterium lotistagni]NHM06303.1 hypothetical protein [Flavobacterium lotistagni]